MTRALAFVLFAGCGPPSSSPPADCGGCRSELVCTRDGRCLPPGEVRAVRITWTVRGAPASPTSCAPAPDLVLDLDSRTGPHVGFEPVPCVEGAFTVDRLSTDYDSVQLGRASDRALPRAAIDAAGHAMLDLPY